MRKKIRSVAVGLAFVGLIMLWGWWYGHQLRVAVLALPYAQLDAGRGQLTYHWPMHLPWPQSGYWFAAALCAVDMVYMAASIVYCSRKHLEHEVGWVELIKVLALLVVFTIALMHISKW